MAVAGAKFSRGFISMHRRPNFYGKAQYCVDLSTLLVEGTLNKSSTTRSLVE